MYTGSIMQRVGLFLILAITMTGYAIGIPPVDISVFMIEVKCDDKQRIKICEIQPACQSFFSGCDYVYQREGMIGFNISRLLSQFGSSLWLMESCIIHEPMKTQLLANGWKAFPKTRETPLSNELLDMAKQTVFDPYNILNYHLIVYGRLPRQTDKEKFHEQYPGIILIDRSSISYWNDKYAQTTLFNGNPVLEQIRPKWGLYPKKYSKDLAKKIKAEINSDMLVIKPRKGYNGNGVIIVEQKNLDATLQTILHADSRLEKNPDRGYNYWPKDTFTTFLVEEFVKSNPIEVPEFHNQLFDVTIRLAVAMIYQEQMLQLHFLGDYCDLPDKSLNEAGNFNEKHKTSLSISQTIKVPPAMREKIQEQLTKPLLMMYKRMLGFDLDQLEEGLASSIVKEFDMEETAYSMSH